MMYPHGSKHNQRYRGPLETEKINIGMTDTNINLSMVTSALESSATKLQEIRSQLNEDQFYEVYKDASLIKVQNDISKGVVDNG